MTARRNTTATQFSVNTVRTISGKILNISVACVKPSPTFWLNDVIGVQPNSPDTLLTKPSQLMAAPISDSFGLRFSALLHKADVSPIVSVADTKYTAITERMAPMLNSGEKGSSLGNEMTDWLAILLKSTIPIEQAIM